MGGARSARTSPIEHCHSDCQCAAAAIVAGVQIAGGLLVPYIRRRFRRRTDGLLIGGYASDG